jgi:hypothetical protein
MTLRERDGHRHDAQSLRRSGLFRYPAARADHCKQASDQASVFITEEQGRMIEHTEKRRFWRFAQESHPTPREAPKLACSVCSIVLPCPSVIKRLT